MPVYKASIRATYYDDLEIEADDAEHAHRIAIQTFKPCGDNLFSIDVFGLDPWTLGEDGNPNEVDEYRDMQRGI